MIFTRLIVQESLWDDTQDSGKTQILSQMKLNKAGTTVSDFRIRTETQRTNSTGKGLVWESTL